MTGMIERLMREQHFGFVRTDDGEQLFFHGTALEGATFAELYERQPVGIFETERGPKGLRANRIVVARGTPRR